jgi:hypothetical protein
MPHIASGKLIGRSGRVTNSSAKHHAKAGGSVLCVGYVRCEDAGGAEAKGKYDIAVFDDAKACEEAKDVLIAARDEADLELKLTAVKEKADHVSEGLTLNSLKRIADTSELTTPWPAAPTPVEEGYPANVADLIGKESSGAISFRGPDNEGAIQEICARVRCITLKKVERGKSVKYTAMMEHVDGDLCGLKWGVTPAKARTLINQAPVRGKSDVQVDLVADSWASEFFADMGGGGKGAVGGARGKGTPVSARDLLKYARRCGPWGKHDAGWRATVDAGIPEDAAVDDLRVLGAAIAASINGIAEALEAAGEPTHCDRPDNSDAAVATLNSLWEDASGLVVLAQGDLTPAPRGGVQGAWRASTGGGGLGEQTFVGVSGGVAAGGSNERARVSNQVEALFAPGGQGSPLSVTSPTVPSAPSRVLGTSVSHFTRVVPLFNKVAGGPEWKDFCEQSVVYTVADAGKHSVTLSSLNTMHGSLDRWLGAMPASVAAPAVLSARLANRADLRADDLINLLGELDDAAKLAAGRGAGASGAGAPSGNGGGSSVWGTSSSGVMAAQAASSGDTVSDRELSVLLADGLRAQSCAKTSDELKAIDAIRLSGDKEGAYRRLEALMLAEPPVRRLIAVGDNVQHTIAGHCQAGFIVCIGGLRDMVLRRLEHVMYGDTVTVGERRSKALRATKQLRFKLVRLMHLLDKEDKSTSEQPLLGFMDVSSEEAVSLFARSINELGRAMQHVQPQYAPDWSAFSAKLGEIVLAAVADGVPWGCKGGSAAGTVSGFLSAVYRALSRSTEDLMAGGPGAQVAPSVELLTSGHFEHVRALQALCVRCGALKVARAAAKEATEQLAEVASKRSAAAAKRKSGEGPALGAGAAKQKPKRSKSAPPRAPPDQVNTPVSQSQADTYGPGNADAWSKSTPAEKKADRESKVKVLLAREGRVGGKEPCFFHFTYGNCKFSAAECKGHHGAGGA